MSTISIDLEADLVALLRQSNQPVERPARGLAHAVGLPIIGTLGILPASKRRGFLPAVRPCVNALVNFGFHISPGLYDSILADAGESR
jgi:predicted nucleic acid-binding protein